MTTTRTTRFEYCMSFVLFTVRRESPAIQIQAGQSVFLASLPYNLITFFLGWWGVPWGLMVTPVVLYRNLCGGIAEFTRPNEAAPSAHPDASAQSPSL